MAELRALFRAFMRASKSYPNYNIREYIRRRAREEFSKDPASTQVDLASVHKQLELVKRQGIVYSLYTRSSKSVMDL